MLYPPPSSGTARPLVSAVAPVRSAKSPRLTLLLIALGAASICNAGTITYTYQGHDFTYVQAPFASLQFVSGYFTTASPLGSNLNEADITAKVLTFAFTDGAINTIDQNDASQRRFIATTNAQGDLIGWDVTLIIGTPPTNGGLFTCNGISTYVNSCPTTPYDWSYENNALINGRVNADPGIWTVSGGQVPEPGGFLCVAVGLMLILFGRPPRN